MSIFRRPDYQSDTTQFIEQLKAGKPGLEQSQRQGRALLWDKQIDREFQAKAEAARIVEEAEVAADKAKSLLKIELDAIRNRHRDEHH